MATAKSVIKVALAEVGYRETGNNHQKYAPAVPGLEWAQDDPWCHTFVSWCAMMADADDIIPKTASCLTGVAWFDRRNRLHDSPKVGDIVYYGRNGGTHVEIVTEVESGRFKTVGGNTRGDLGDGYAEGDAVAVKWVFKNASNVYAFGRPAYDSSGKPEPGDGPRYPGRVLKLANPYMKGADVKAWQARMRADHWGLTADGIYGPQSQAVCRAFQRQEGLAVDGQVGPKTWAASFR
ncbi:peptidoglycan-binding protein [Nonomuraea rubra]|uniref:C40 family peptidase n=1 Tax=Nonomuraea rubra TaxID=46180 RepID=UPI003409345C